MSLAQKGTYYHDGICKIAPIVYLKVCVSPMHYVMRSNLSDYGPDLAASGNKFTEKPKRIGLQTWKLLLREDFKTINMTKIAIKGIFVYKQFSQIIIMK